MSIHVAITRQVREGFEREFGERLLRFAQTSLSHPGATGVQILHPAPGSGSREYGVLRSFASEADRADFYRSPAFQEWEREVRDMVEGEYRQRELHGLEAFFHQKGAPHPPRWKMATATLIGVYPTSLALGFLLVPFLHGWPRPLAGLAVAVTMVACLTWLVMPAVTRALHRWLTSGR